MVDTTMIVPTVRAARAVASSPSGSARRWKAVGATSTGTGTAVPSTVVEASMVDTSTSTRLWKRHRWKARSFSRTVHSVRAPLT